MLNLKRMLCILVLLMFLLCGTRALAEQARLGNEDAQAGMKNAIGYAVEPILPANQTPGYTTTFHLRVVPGGRQMIQVLISNWANEDIEVAVEAGAAFTNENGVIEYGQNLDESLAVDFSSIVTAIEPVVRVPANGQATAEFLLMVPEKPFRGTVFGGFTFTKLHQDKANSEAGGSMQIQNIFRYVINARLHESDEEIRPAFALLSANVDVDRRSPVLVLQLRNSEPVIVRQASLRVNVSPLDGGPAVFSAENDISMAPNSSVPYLVYCNEAKTLPAGIYRVLVEIEHKDQIWRLEAPLTIE